MFFRPLVNGVLCDRLVLSIHMGSFFLNHRSHLETGDVNKACEIDS